MKEGKQESGCGRQNSGVRIQEPEEIRGEKSEGRSLAKVETEDWEWREDPNFWQHADISEIEWVRLVRDRGGCFGIGFLNDQLVHFLGTDNPVGLVRPVSLMESAILLAYLATRELNLQPDVESNPVAWRKWLEMITKQA